MNIVADVGDYGPMMGWDHMMDWWGLPYIGYWGFLIWIVQIFLAVLVYKDAQKKKQNSLLWSILVILPWIGILFLVVYLILREEEADIRESIDEGNKIIDERYAKGEITREEYLQMKRDIKEFNERKNEK